MAVHRRSRAATAHGFVSGLALVAALSLSCGESDEDAQRGPAPLAIQGGQPERGYEAVGRLPRRPEGSCTAVLVSPHWVLTAQHCVIARRASAITFEVDRESGTRTTHPFDDKFAHPTMDLALLHLTSPIDDVEPLPFAEQLPAPGDTCVGVGYGAHDDDAGRTTFGEKRSCTQTVREIEDREVVVGRASGIADSGDSGGPLLCGGAISGVVRGPVGGGPKDEPSAREAYTKLDLEWVARVARIETAVAAGSRAAAAARPSEPAIAWPTYGQGYRGLTFQKIAVGDSFPSAFRLGALASPPESARIMESDERGFVLGHIVGVEPGHPAEWTHFESVSSSYESFDTGVLTAAWCSPVTAACYQETRKCAVDGMHLTDCMLTGHHGDAALKRVPSDFIRGLNDLYRVVYLPGDAARDSIVAATLNHGAPVSRGVHLVAVRMLRDKELERRDACWDRATNDALAEYNREFGTRLSLDEFGTHDAFPARLMRAGIKAGCIIGGEEMHVVEDASAVSLALRMGFFHEGFRW